MLRPKSAHRQKTSLMPDGEITRAAQSKSKTSFSLLPDKLSPLHILRATPSHKRSFPADAQTSITKEMLHSSSLALGIIFHV